jgi:hypothetical protein
VISLQVPVSSELHTRLKMAVLKRYQYSKRKMKDYHQQWEDADDSMKAYIPEREVDYKKRQKKKYSGEVDYVTLEVPYTYAQVMTAHTYWSSVFLSRSPVWQFTGRHGESQDSVQAVEAVMDYQTKVGQHLPWLYNWLYDLARYSLGIIGAYWEEEEISVSKIEMVKPSLLGVELPGKAKPVRKTEIVKGYVGNRLYCVSPYDFYPDPRVPICNFQAGEYCLRETSEGLSSLMSASAAYPGLYVNLQEAMKIKGGAWDREQGSARTELPERDEADSAPGVGYLNLLECYIKLVPSAWGLGASNRVELWQITLAQREIVIACKPLGLYHNKFPFAVMEGNFGADSFVKLGTVEVIRPLTDVMTWLFNSHFYNVRKALNDTRVVDPSRIVMKDLLKPTPGGIVRLKPEAYGTDPRQAIHQLQQVDVTRSHINDTIFVEQMLQRVSGIVDNLMGSQSNSGRKTATEVRTSSGWSSNRLKVPAEYNSSLGWDPLAQMMLSNTQQFMDLERKYQIAGNSLDQAAKFVQVTPEQIAGFFDFVPVDGTLPIDRLAQANFWKELLMQMARVPELAMQWDLGAMLAHTMKLQGERNVDRFRIQLSPMDVLARQAAAGNVIPLGGKGGSGSGNGAGKGAPGSSGRTV